MNLLSFISSCNPYLFGLAALLGVILYAGADMLFALFVKRPLIELGLIARYLVTRGLFGLWVDLCTFIFSLIGGAGYRIVKACTCSDPLPRSTNAPLIGLGVLIWSFALGISFWGDSRTFVVLGVLLIGSLGTLIICGAAPERQD
jgi:hypothetical protein